MTQGINADLFYFYVMCHGMFMPVLCIRQCQFYSTKNVLEVFSIQFRQSLTKETFSYNEHLQSYGYKY